MLGFAGCLLRKLLWVWIVVSIYAKICVIVHILTVEPSRARGLKLAVASLAALVALSNPRGLVG